MYKVETEYHLITSSSNQRPRYKCKGVCKKVYWESDIIIKSIIVEPKCEACGGDIRNINTEDYKVLEFKITPQNFENMTMEYMSEVKKEHVEFAKLNWIKE